MSKGWIGVDLDGTLAHYNTWQSIEHIGEPIAPMVERVKTWLADGRDVRIFTARVSGWDERSLAAVKRHITAWCEKHIGKALTITNVKDFHMLELWDDRAVQVEANTGQPVGYSTRSL